MSAATAVFELAVALNGRRPLRICGPPIVVAAMLSACSQPQAPRAPTLRELCDAPFPAYWKQDGLELRSYHHPFNYIMIKRDGRLLWNGPL